MPGKDCVELDEVLQIAYRIARKWCRIPADADDIAQEAVLRFSEAQPRPTNPVAWLSVVVRRLSNRSRLRSLAQRDAEAAFVEGSAPSRADIDLLIDLSQVMLRLNARHRRVIGLLIEGAQSADIAAVFGCSVRDVGQMVARARRGAQRARNHRKPP